jgi:hypothetical protein
LSVLFPRLFVLGKEVSDGPARRDPYSGPSPMAQHVRIAVNMGQQEYLLLQKFIFPSDHGLCKFPRKLSNLVHIFGGNVHLFKSYNFRNYGFLTFHIKNGFSILLGAKRGRTCVFCAVATKGTLQNSTTPIFMGGEHCRNAISKI